VPTYDRLINNKFFLKDLNMTRSVTRLRPLINKDLRKIFLCPPITAN
jgi:hypothetical protein